MSGERLKCGYKRKITIDRSYRKGGRNRKGTVNTRAIKLLPDVWDYDGR